MLLLPIFRRHFSLSDHYAIIATLPLLPEADDTMSRLSTPLRQIFTPPRATPFERAACHDMRCSHILSYIMP